jgi:hypothetical protein
MYLTREQERMLAGEYGEVLERNFRHLSERLSCYRSNLVHVFLCTTSPSSPSLFLLSDTPFLTLLLGATLI